MNGRTEPNGGIFGWGNAASAQDTQASKDRYFDGKQAKPLNAEELNARVIELRAQAFASRSPRNILKKLVPQPFELN